MVQFKRKGSRICYKIDTKFDRLNMTQYICGFKKNNEMTRTGLRIVQCEIGDSPV